MTTPTSTIVPVRYAGRPAILKVADRERAGAALMAWWGGDGAARVLAHEGDALVMERASGRRSLAEMARSGPAFDDDASRILCEVSYKLHAPRVPPPPAVVPLRRWFDPLALAASRHGGVFEDAAAVANELLLVPQDVVVLHGDLHHANVLDAGPRGWLAIDPKGLYGERTFEFACLFLNPDSGIATARGRLRRQASVVARAAALDRARLLKWIMAYGGLSAAWALEDGDDVALALAVAELARSELAAC